MILKSPRSRLRVVAAVAVASLLSASAPAVRVDAAGPVRIRARELSHPVVREHTFALPLDASHVALHWPGQPHARILVAFSRDGVDFDPPVPVAHDEFEDAGGHDEDEETYGSVMVAGGATAVRVTSDRPIPRVSVVAIDSRDTRPQAWSLAPTAAAATTQPGVISRAAWGADESLRFDASGKEIWPRRFHPVQKFIVHHTAGKNGDPDPPATVRAIYYYYSVTRGYGDHGYNFLVDEAGNIYEGRYSRSYAAGEYPTGEDLEGNSVQGGHALNHNAGTVGISLLGTLSEQDATPAARSAVERMVAWKADRHDIDPQRSALYVNPVNGAEATFANIAGHRDVRETQCPGGYFYDTLPSLRKSVAARIGSTFWQSAGPSSVTLPETGGTATYTVSLTRSSFSDPVSFTLSGLPEGASATFSSNPTTGDSSTLTLVVPGSVAPGVYTLAVTGTSGAIARTSSIRLLKEEPSFSVSASPSSVTLPDGGGTGSYSIALTRSSLFADPVSFSVSGLPEGTSASFDPNPTASDSSALTVQVPSSVPAGSYAAEVTATGGGVTRTASMTLVKELPPDTVAPTVKAPAQRFVLGSRLGTSAVPVMSSWSATDDRNGIARYEFQQSTDGGSWSRVTLPTSTTTSILRSLTPGHSYRFRVRATDGVGNTSAWAEGARFVVGRFQETHSAIRYTGTWTRRYASSAYGTYLKYATAAGAQATFSFTGRNVAWIAPKSTGRGRAYVYVDGNYVTTVNLYSSTYLSRRVVFSRSWWRSGTHSLTIRVVGTSGHPRVDVDAFIVLH